MTLRLSGHFSVFALVFFVLKSLLGIVRQWSHEKFAILTLKPRILFSISNVGYDCNSTSPGHSLGTGDRRILRLLHRIINSP